MSHMTESLIETLQTISKTGKAQKIGSTIVGKETASLILAGLSKMTPNARKAALSKIRKADLKSDINSAQEQSEILVKLAATARKLAVAASAASDDIVDINNSITRQNFHVKTMIQAMGDLENQYFPEFMESLRHVASVVKADVSNHDLDTFDEATDKLHEVKEMFDQVIRQLPRKEKDAADAYWFGYLKRICDDEMTVSIENTRADLENLMYGNDEVTEASTVLAIRDNDVTRLIRRLKSETEQLASWSNEVLSGHLQGANRHLIESFHGVQRSLDTVTKIVAEIAHSKNLSDLKKSEASTVTASDSWNDIVIGYAKAVFASGIANAVDDAKDQGLIERTPWGGGDDVMDFIPEVPSEIVSQVESHLTKTGKDKVIADCNDFTTETGESADTYGHYLAMQQMGSGVGLEDYDYKSKLPRVSTEVVGTAYTDDEEGVPDSELAIYLDIGSTFTYNVPYSDVFG